jgi:DNA gyrase subunit A
MTLSHPLPDVRDGLSLVQRRVLLAMRDGGLVPGGAFKRSAAIAREVSKRFRPRPRDSSYDALVAMVQDFTLRYPLIEGEGNCGSIDGDAAAAPQYTEARLLPIARELLRRPITPADRPSQPCSVAPFRTCSSTEPLPARRTR